VCVYDKKDPKCIKAHFGILLSVKTDYHLKKYALIRVITFDKPIWVDLSDKTKEVKINFNFPSIKLSRIRSMDTTQKELSANSL
jgi:hypothetical protein